MTTVPHSTMSCLLWPKKDNPSQNSRQKGCRSLAGLRSVAGSLIAVMQAYETKNDATLISNAQSTPRLNSSGAASGGPITAAVLAVAPEMPNARGRSSFAIAAAMIANLDGLKNCEATLAISTQA